MIKVLVNGPSGKMGRAITQSAYKNTKMKIIGGIGPAGRPYIGKDLGILVGLGNIIGAKVYDDINQIIEKSDIVLDCTRADVTLKLLETCLKYKKSLVTGTTGFSDKEKRKIEKAGLDIPVLLAANTSRVAHVFFEIIQLLTKKLGQDADIDIIEMHENKKPDAPSGTAIEIASIISDQLGVKLQDIAEYGRKGKEIRPPQSICFSSIRSGGFPSSHKIIFGFQNEKIELQLDGYNMHSYADGIIDAALFLSNKKPGFYTIEEVFGK
ncbi:MAG TPA: 4-hydroxy-tetrahydrodipicolinate reductase [Atribacterota bacterium]|nr:4-hydroxy-tetrahydrodipicolinate reductase [Atribacterota bacterium]